MPVGRSALGLSMNITWRESCDQKGWVQQPPFMSWRNIGKGVGVEVGIGVGVGDGLGRGVDVGVRGRVGCGVGDGLAVGGVSAWDACETRSDGSTELSTIGEPESETAGVSWMAQPVAARTVSRAQTTSVSTNVVALRASWVVPWRPDVTFTIVC
jgi:hypothetical protein